MSSGVRIRVDASDLTNQVYKRWMYLSYDNFRYISDLEKKIREDFPDKPLQLMLQDPYILPSNEKILILQNNDVVLVKKLSNDSEQPPKKKRKLNSSSNDETQIKKFRQSSSKSKFTSKKQSSSSSSSSDDDDDDDDDTPKNSSKPSKFSTVKTTENNLSKKQSSSSSSSSDDDDTRELGTSNLSKKAKKKSSSSSSSSSDDDTRELGTSNMKKKSSSSSSSDGESPPKIPKKTIPTEKKKIVRSSDDEDSSSRDKIKNSKITSTLLNTPIKEVAFPSDSSSLSIEVDAKILENGASTSFNGNSPRVWSVRQKKSGGVNKEWEILKSNLPLDCAQISPPPPSPKNKNGDGKSKRKRKRRRERRNNNKIKLYQQSLKDNEQSRPSTTNVLESSARPLLNKSSDSLVAHTSTEFKEPRNVRLSSNSGFVSCEEALLLNNGNFQANLDNSDNSSNGLNSLTCASDLNNLLKVDKADKPLRATRSKYFNRKESSKNNESSEENYTQLPLLEGSCIPKKGDIFVFKVLELDENYSPVVSNYKKGQVVEFDSSNKQKKITFKMLKDDSTKSKNGKFEIDDDQTGEHNGIKTFNWENELNDVRIFKQ